MDKVHMMDVFTRVVEMNSFSRAAAVLGMSRTTATMAVQRLEASLEVRLLNRTTRSLQLTEEGVEYFERAKRLLASLAEMEEAFSRSGGLLKGRLRVEVSALLGRAVITPQLHEFYRCYPDIDLAIDYGDIAADLVQEGIDCAIRVGDQPDSTLISRNLGHLSMATVATPEYLSAYGTPESVLDLKKHVVVRYVPCKTSRFVDAKFVGDDVLQISDFARESYVFNDAEACLSFGLNGTGIFQAPRFLVRSLIDAGTLVEVLHRSRAQALPISLVYPQKLYMAGKLRVFAQWAAKLFADSGFSSSAPANLHWTAEESNASLSFRNVRQTAVSERASPNTSPVQK